MNQHTIVVDTRICCACNCTFRAQGIRPQCPACESTLSVVVSSRTISDLAQLPDPRERVS